MRQLRRNPPTWIALIAVTAALGLGSRRFGRALPDVVAAYAGDTLWALVVFLALGTILPGASTWVVALSALCFSGMIEASQLYHAPWIDSVRSTGLGGLVLGRGFLWSDLVCYMVGVGLGSLIDRTLLRIEMWRPSAQETRK